MKDHPWTALAVIGEPFDGVGYVRFAQPFGRLAERGFTLRTLGRSMTLERGPGGYRASPALLDGVDLLIFPQMVASPILADGGRVEVVEPLCREARRRDIPVVYSVDDYLARIEPHNPGYDRIQGSLDNLDTIRAHAAAILVTTPSLAESLAPWGVPIHLLPNAIDPAHWKARPRSSGELRVGWTGSSSHLDDLLMLLPAIAELQRRVPSRFVMAGLTDMPLAAQLAQIERHWDAFDEPQRVRAEGFIELCGLLRAVRHEHRPFVATAEFFRSLPALDLDIGVCPLLDTPFNRHKSAVKFYEYAITGSLTVASSTTPYVKEVSLTVPDDPQAWCEVLERHLRDETARDEEFARQRDFVLTERNIEHWAPRWADCLSEVARGVTA